MLNGISQKNMDINKMAKQTKQSRFNRNDVLTVTKDSMLKKTGKEQKKYEKKMEVLRQEREQEQRKANQLNNRNKKS